MCIRDRVEALALLEAAAAHHDQPGVAAAGRLAERRHRVEAGRVGGGRDRAPQVLQRAARDPEQEEVEDGEEAELESHRDRVVVHVGTLVTGDRHRSTSKLKVVVPIVTESPAPSRVEPTRRPLTLIPLVEPRSAIVHSPDWVRRSSAWWRETLGSRRTQSASLERPIVARGPSST